MDNPDAASELELLQSYGPSVPESLLLRLLRVFGELRELVEDASRAVCGIS